MAPDLTYDIIIVGGGSAGCVLANRLSADRARSVLLIESGPNDQSFPLSPYILMPMALPRLISNPAFAFHYPAEQEQPTPALTQDVWVRGRVLGGSSSVNGMVYHRGQPQDYDRLVELGNDGWGWRDILPYFIEIEGHVLPKEEWRGRDGPLALAAVPKSRLSDAIIAAGEACGLPRKEDANLPDHRGISYVIANIDARGRRVSAARAFLPASVRARPNLTILMGTQVERVLFHDRDAIGVRVIQDHKPRDIRANEVIISAGTTESPLLLQRSGIGSAALLQSMGIPIIHDNPNVGAHLRDHWKNYQAFNLRYKRDSSNHQYAGWRLGLNVMRWLAGAGGPLATPIHHVSAFAETMPGFDRADVQLLFAPCAWGPPASDGSLTTMSTPAMHVYSHALRNTSEGSITITSPNLGDTPLLRLGHLATDYDRRISVNGMKIVRSIMEKPEIQTLIAGELAPSADARSDDDLLHYSYQYGSSGLHAVGTCRMGPEGDRHAVVDSRLRVGGVDHLRVIDCSIFPEVISGNTNAPVMAMAARAADLVLADLRV
jgi:choline dehydrogenase-like flavoprotein